MRNPFVPFFVPICLLDQQWPTWTAAQRLIAETCGCPQLRLRHRGVCDMLTVVLLGIRVRPQRNAVEYSLSRIRKNSGRARVFPNSDESSYAGKRRFS